MSDGSSGTPLAKKLGIKEGAVVALVEAPEGFVGALGPLPPGVSFDAGSGPFDVVVSFCRTLEDLDGSLARLPRTLKTAGGLWIAWPKRSSGVATDLSDGVVRDLGLETGLVDNKVCAIDATWSALRFVRRLADR